MDEAKWRKWNEKIFEIRETINKKINGMLLFNRNIPFIFYISSSC